MIADGVGGDDDPVIAGRDGHADLAALAEMLIHRERAGEG